ncbi:OLC1v1038145C1 [Oldenlandia corymbosa var. corymbosa]|uniref:OLC1v1038145C1 n=1 Tax=Oldenlandia corymbosa var. corymbosa TaxID=529605 RepID=A0AAV1CZ47_OLDCO|nr:OLC1v1038145C1 [Oldenlandia corymbosa var. corymbosa]
MDNECKMDDGETPVVAIYRIPGEPAIVVNGLPPLPTDAADFSASDVLPGGDSKPPEKIKKSTGYGEWLVGREVQKSFGGHFYNGKVTKFDQDTGWYRVAYEDGDSEDLEWPELEAVLQPMDITVPLKTIAAKITRRQQKTR